MSGGKWSPEHRAAYEKAIAKRRKAKDDEVKALIAANRDKTKTELGISGWKAFDGSDGGYNARFLRNARVGVDLPPIDIRDNAQVAERIEMYFDHCEQTEVLPNLIGLANWLGVNRTTLDRWKRGDFSPDKSPLIQRAISIIEEALVSQVQGEKKNPASGIFLMKSIFHFVTINQ